MTTSGMKYFIVLLEILFNISYRIKNEALQHDCLHSQIHKEMKGAVQFSCASLETWRSQLCAIGMVL